MLWIRNRKLVLFGVSALAAACAASAPVPPTTIEVASETLETSGFDETTVTATSIVEKIDRKSRSVTLREPDGNILVLELTDAVKNLEQVKVGDRVTATIFESLRYQIMPKGSAEPGAAEMIETATAEPGERPGGVVASEVNVIATVRSVDKKAETVTLVGPSGKVAVIKVRNAKRLNSVKKGDLVEIISTRAVAIAVEKAP